MESDFLLITSMSAPNKLSSRYFAQLDAAGIPYRVYPNSMTTPNDGSLGACATAWRRWAEENSSYSRLIITDAWDVLCYGTHERVNEILLSLPTFPVFAGERNCYPQPELASLITGRTPWRFVNGGMLTSSPGDLINWCNLIELHPAYNPYMLAQQWLNQGLAAGDPLVKVDWETRLFYCLFLEDQGNELGVKDGQPFNALTSTSPPFIHFNGSWPTEPFLRMMGENV